MTQRKALYGSTALLIAISGMAQADVTAADVWDNMSSFYSAAGYEMSTGSVTDAGGTVTVTDMVVSLPNPYADMQEEIAIDILATVPLTTLTENGDGTVTVTSSDQYTVVVEITPEGDVTGRIGMTIDQTGTTTMASGDPGLVTYSVNSPAITAKLDILEIPEEDEIKDAFEATITMTGLAGTYTMGSGDTPTLALDLAASAMDAVISGREPGGPGSLDANIALQAVKWMSNTSFAVGAEGVDLASTLKAGMTSNSDLSHGGSTYSFDFNDRGDAFAMTGSAASGSTVSSMSDQGLSYLISNTGMSVSMSGSEIPLPEVSFAAGATAFGLTMPVIASDMAQDMGLTVRLEGLTVADMIWGMLDPSAQIPRDPANIILEIAGKGNWNFDVIDPMGLAGMGGGMPGSLEALDINELELTLAGASLKGMGGFTFDMDNLGTFGGVPAPTGAVDLQLDGANGLMDTLVAMGLLPEDQAMGARMMMGLFARPGEGDDSLVSKIEIDGATGAISANGQRIQ